MTTKAAERMDELRRRIDRLEEKAHAAGAEARDSMKSTVEALRRQQASARAAVGERVDAADAELERLDANVADAERRLVAAELADDARESQGGRRARRPRQQGR